MHKRNLLIYKNDKHYFYQIDRVGKKTILLKVYRVENRQPGGFAGKFAGYYIRENRAKIEKELGKTIELIS